MVFIATYTTPPYKLQAYKKSGESLLALQQIKNSPD
ncbi:hypothetical protein EVA_01850 [gut metagenome]|uniref:Uncharacterized protein n=1 Tax=gut metagenome TaxID=749906 RepID=J9GPD2_9ZZZZ